MPSSSDSQRPEAGIRVQYPKSRSNSFEIRIDGTPRSYRDRNDYAMEAAQLIKSKQPHSLVEIKDF